MSKVEVAGPREILLPVLETIRREEVLEIASDIKERIREDTVQNLRPVALDTQALAERLVLEDLGNKIGRLLTLLPKVQTRESYLSPSLAVDSIASLVGKHLDACQERLQRKASPAVRARAIAALPGLSGRNRVAGTQGCGGSRSRVHRHPGQGSHGSRSTREGRRPDFAGYGGDFREDGRRLVHRAAHDREATRA